MFAIPLTSQAITINTGTVNAAWGGITGTLSSQTDLQAALDAKLTATSYTAADVLSKLLTVDGAGSLLDADFLDGQSGAYYLAWANLTGVPGTFPPSAHGHTLDDLSDVIITTPSNGQVLKYNGTNWVNDTDLIGGGGGALNDLTDVVITAAATNDVLQYDGANWVDLPLTLDQIANPAANKTFTMANKTLTFSYTAPVGADGGFEIEALGGFSGDLVHIHQHTGNPGAGTDLVHIECVDPDVLALRVVHSGIQGIRIESPSTTQQNGQNISLLNPGGYAGSSFPGILMSVYNTGTGHPFYGWRIAKGTEAAPTAAAYPNTLGVFVGYAHDGTSFVEQGRFGLRLNSGFAAGTPKGDFFVSLNNNTAAYFMLFSTGNLAIGYASPVDDGVNKLQVGGKGKFTDILTVTEIQGTTNLRLLTNTTAGSDTGAVFFCAANAADAARGAAILAYGVNHATLPSKLDLYAGNATGGDIRFYTSNIAHQTIFRSGNIAIGATVDNGYKVEITGTTHITAALTLDSALGIASGGTGQTSAANAINALLPSQTGNNGKFLQTDGSVCSWQSTAGGGAIALDDLTDVATAGVLPGSLLKYNGTTWVPDVTDTLGLNIAINLGILLQ